MSTPLSEKSYDELEALRETILIEAEDLLENMQQLAFSREDAGWEKIYSDSKGGISHDHLIKQSSINEMFVAGNPLIKRAVAVRIAYIHGQGVGTTAKGEDINGVVQNFLDDPMSREVLFGTQAQEQLEQLLATDGNVFVTMVTDRSTGAVTPRIVPLEEVKDIITAPGDRAKVQYYLREWTEYDIHTDRTTQRKAYYPALRYYPARLMSNLRGHEVMWESPIYHIKVNAARFSKWGIPDCYASIPWARAYKEFIEDWLVMMKSLSKITYQHYRMTYSRGSQEKRRALENMSDVAPGSTASLSPGDRIEALSKTGATIDPDLGKVIVALIAAGFGIPLITLTTDPGQTGARATAETLSHPTKLTMESRQEVWVEFRRQILHYVILQAIRSASHPLKGKVTQNVEDMTYEVASEEDATLTITYPPLDETPVEIVMNALVKADSTGKVPPLLMLELILRKLNVRDVDEWLKQVQDADGNFIYPDTQTDEAAGSAAARAWRAGSEPGDYI